MYISTVSIRRLLRGPHRHLVVGPLFLTVLGSSFLLARRNVLPPPQQPAFQEHVLQEGSKLVQGEGIVGLRTGFFDVRGLSGAFTASVSGKNLSIAALTTPVIVREGEGTIVIPAGMQWRTENAHLPADWRTWHDDLLPVPRHFLREQLASLKQPPGSSASPQHANALRAQIASNADLWLLASLHPTLKRFAWPKPPPDGVPGELAFLRLLLFPRSDSAADAISPVLVRLWKHDVAGMLAADRDVKTTLMEVLPLWIRDIAAMEEHGLRDRARRYRQALAEATAPYEILLPQRLLAAVRAPQRTLTASVIAMQTPVASASSTSSVSSVLALSPPELERRARSALSAAGALFTIHSVFRPVSHAAVEVSDVFFAATKGAVKADFTYDVVTGKVSAISWNGKMLPYALPLDRFVEWAKHA